MKRVNLLIISSLFAVFFAACGPTTEDAINFNDAVIAEQKTVLDKENHLINTIANNQQDQIKLVQQELLDQIDKSIKTVEELKGHSKFDEFKDATIKLFVIYKEVVANDYSEIIKIAMLPDEEYTQEADDKMNEISGQIDSKLEKALTDFGKAQEKFAQELNFTLRTKNSNI